jgi:hypothetical protein
VLAGLLRAFCLVAQSHAAIERQPSGSRYILQGDSASQDKTQNGRSRAEVKVFALSAEVPEMFVPLIGNGQARTKTSMGESGEGKKGLVAHLTRLIRRQRLSRDASFAYSTLR